MSIAEQTPAAPVMAPRPPRTWKFVGTAIWGLLAFGAMSLAQVAGLIAVLGFFADADMSEASIKTVSEHGAAIAVSVLLGLPATLLVLWLATRLARRSFAAYLALRRPTAKDILLALAASLALLATLDAIAVIAGYPVSPDFVLNSVRSARDSGTLWLLLLGFCVAAPVSEEFIFRGFVYRGWSATALGPAGAIVLSSALFALIHVQYEWFYLGGIFAIGSLFGYLRYRLRSTWTTVIAHGFYNLVAAIQGIWLIS